MSVRIIPASRRSTTELLADVSSKADKVTSATAGNLAELDALGNLVDSGIAADDVNPAVFDIELDVTAGLFDFSVTGVTEFSWYFPEDGTISTASRPAKTLTEEQTVLLSAKWGSEAELKDNGTDAKYVGDLSDVSNVSYFLNLDNCVNTTGDLSDVSNVSYFLNLDNCSNITGDLSDVSNVSYTLGLYNCSNITGDLSDVSNVSYLLRLRNCSNITGSLSSSCIATYIDLNSIGCSSAELDTTIANLVTANQSDGTLILLGLTRTAASSADVATLESRGWTVTDATIV